MGKNIFQLEADNIRSYLERHGYASEQRADHIIVKDPVQCSGAKDSERTEYKDVIVRGFGDAISFVEARE